MDNFDIIFESDRIYFVKVSEILVNDYLKMVNDIEVQKFISHKRKNYTVEQELEWIRSKLNENSIIFSMIEKGSNAFIGNIEIMNVANNLGEIGISITRRQQDKHFGQEALKRFIEYAFVDLNLDGLELNVYDFNERGIHCYEKVGFEVVGDAKTQEEVHMKIMK